MYDNDTTPRMSIKQIRQHLRDSENETCVYLCACIGDDSNHERIIFSMHAVAHPPESV